MGSDEEQQAALLEQYSHALEQNPTALSPAELDPELAEQAQLLRRGLDAPAPTLAYRTRLKAQLQTALHGATGVEQASVMTMLPDIGAGRFSQSARTNPLRRWFFPRLATAAVVALIVIFGWFLIGNLNNPTAPLSAAQILQRAQGVFTDGSIQSVAMTVTTTRSQIVNYGRSLPTSASQTETVTNYTAFWYQAPNLWRTEDASWSTYSRNGNLNGEVSDGTNVWSYSYSNPSEGAIPYKNQVDVSLFTSLPDTISGVQPLVHIARSQFDTLQTINGCYKRGDGLGRVCDAKLDTVQANNSCYKPSLMRSEFMARRMAYVIDTGDTQCAPFNRYTLWIDQSTYFVLRIDLKGQPVQNDATFTSTITTEFNQTIDPGVFSFILPPGATFYDHRPQAPSQHLTDTPTP